MSIKEMTDEIHRQFAYAVEGNKKADRARLRAGQLLNDLRARIEGGEIGENINWWKWYEENFARSRKDAEKVMKIARDADPEAAGEAAAEANRKAQAKHRAKKNAAYVSGNQSDSEIEDLVSHALRLVEEMDANQRRRFIAELRRAYADSF